jgi:hypothetical protein
MVTGSGSGHWTRCGLMSVVHCDIVSSSIFKKKNWYLSNNQWIKSKKSLRTCKYDDTT